MRGEWIGEVEEGERERERETDRDRERRERGRGVIYISKLVICV